ncbi:TPA: NADAR family protein [Photobacterium damselae]
MRITDNFVFFHSANDLFSQWNMDYPFTYHGIFFKSCEHWMMVKKLTFFVHRGKTVRQIKQIIEQEKKQFQIERKYPANSIYQMLEAPTPRLVKSLGKQVYPFNTEEWNTEVPNVLNQGNFLKFTQNQAALEIFRQCHRKTFVEASPTDRIYGVGLHENDPRIDNPNNWLGQNKLGFCLTILSHNLFD